MNNSIGVIIANLDELISDDVCDPDLINMTLDNSEFLVQKIFEFGGTQIIAMSDRSSKIKNKIMTQMFSRSIYDNTLIYGDALIFGINTGKFISINLDMLMANLMNTIKFDPK